MVNKYHLKFFSPSALADITGFISGQQQFTECLRESGVNSLHIELKYNFKICL